MAAAAQSFTIQLNSSTAEKTSANEERFQLNLSPAIDVPYLAQARAQLESLAFSNSFVNVAEHLGNNKIAFQLAYAQTTEDANGHYQLDSELGTKLYELTILDGHYNVAQLEEELARQAWLTHKATDKVTAGHATYEPPNVITPTTSLWSDMNILVTRKPYVNGPKDPGDGGSTDSETSSWKLASVVSKGDRTIDLVAQHDSKTGQPLGYHLIEATLSSAEIGTYGLTNVFAADTKISFIAPPSGGKQTIHLSTGIATAVPSGSLNDTAILITPAAEYGYGVKEIAEPSLNPQSGWGQVLSADEMRLISETKGIRANSIIPTEYIQKSTTDANPTAIAQKDRYVKPFYLAPDESTGRMQIYLAVPAIAVLEDSQATPHGLSSTLVTDVLGYKLEDMARQDPLVNRPGGTGKPWVASGPGRLLRTRSLQFHCPTFINSSYDNNGKRQGGLLADIPITVPPGYVQSWSAAFDNSVPAAVHGGAIDSVIFYMTNQDGEALHNQGQTFQATLRLFWDDPVPPQIGSAGAEAEDAFGLRDVMYAR